MSELSPVPSGAYYQDHDINNALRRHGADIEVGNGINDKGEKFVRLFNPRTSESKDVLEADLVSSKPQNEQSAPAEAIAPSLTEEMEKRPNVLKRLAKRVVGSAEVKVVSSNPYDAVDDDGKRLYTRLTTIDEHGEQSVRYLRNE